MPPGNIFQRFAVTSAVAPFAFKSSDAGFGGGLAIADIDFRGSRRREFLGVFGSYSTEQQQSYGAVWRRRLHHLELPEGGVLIEERSAIRAFAGYARTRTRRFFGLGPGTKNSEETRYEDERVELELGITKAYPDPGDDLVLSAGIVAEFHQLGDGLGSEDNTSDNFKDLFDEASGRDLGWIQLGARWDTRDSQTNPYRGWHVGGLAEGALVQSRFQVGARYTIDASKVFPLPGLFHGWGDAQAPEENPATDTLFFGFRTQFISGDLPFFSLPSLGGRTLRGFVRGRFRDDAAWLGTAEYRFWLLERGIGFTRVLRIERLGAALFYDAGTVGDHLIQQFGNKVEHSYGVSLIASLERALPVRANFGFSRDGANITFGFGLSF